MPAYLNGRPATSEEVVAAMPPEIVDRIGRRIAERIKARDERDAREVKEAS